MTPPEDSVSTDSIFATGNRCLLLIMGQRYLVSIQKVTEDEVSVSFPVRDFPVEGMRVDMEFHDLEGFTRFESEVVSAPKEVGDYLVLRRPPQSTRNYHRGSWRVPVDFKAEIKGHVHPRRFHVPVINLSTGGMLILCGSELAVGDMVEASLPVPALQGEKMTCTVIHRSEEPAGPEQSFQTGCSFVSPDPETIKAISAYIWERIRELGPKYSPTAL